MMLLTDSLCHMPLPISFSMIPKLSSHPVFQPCHPLGMKLLTSLFLLALSSSHTAGLLLKPRVSDC